MGDIEGQLRLDIEKKKVFEKDISDKVSSLKYEEIFRL